MTDVDLSKLANEKIVFPLETTTYSAFASTICVELMCSGNPTEVLRYVSLGRLSTSCLALGDYCLYFLPIPVVVWNTN